MTDDLNFMIYDLRDKLSKPIFKFLHLCDASPPKVIVFKNDWKHIYCYSNDHPSLLLCVKLIDVDESYDLCPKTVVRHLCSESSHSGLLSYDQGGEQMYLI